MERRIDEVEASFTDFLDGNLDEEYDLGQRGYPAGTVKGHPSDQPTSSECLDSFLNRWVSSAGWPERLKCDRGLHNRGKFARCSRDTACRFGKLVSRRPTDTKIERQGDILKSMLKKVIRQNSCIGYEDIEYDEAADLG
jgi:hypothetical protein